MSKVELNKPRDKYLPEVEIVNRSLLITHVDVEGEEVNRGLCATTEDFEKGGQPISYHVVGKLFRFVRHLDGF